MEHESLLKQSDMPNKSPKPKHQDLKKKLEKVAEDLNMPNNEQRTYLGSVDVKTTNANLSSDNCKSFPSNSNITLENVSQMQERLQKEILDLKSIIKGHSQQATK